MTSRQRVVLIAGPTASGKSALAMALAREIGGVVVNADSMQVYRDLRILSARPSDGDEVAVPHALYGFVDAAEAYSTGKWLDAVGTVLDRAAVEDRVAIVVGGTGLYFRALEHGLAALPGIPDAIREKWRGRLAELGAEALHDELRKVDAELAARLERGDSQRLVRALEVREATGRSLLDWQRQATDGGLLSQARIARLLVTIDRQELYRRCDRRFDRMLADGAIEETRALAARRLDPRLPAMKALGVPQLMALLNGEVSLESATESVRILTRRYAKRQLTWFRGNMIAWNAISAHDSQRMLADIFPILDESRLTCP